ncbi:hypothetical protein [Vallitalea okinawensis]|uniref:hypothetical protein n=1 Tax=Vallitalea okinawensis TaxID=2078660 RepID=UPI000CFAE488|nr:hypothetical protein [Vallitalea okinawensis]
MGEKVLDNIQADTTVYDCISCGSDLEFDPASQALKCPYCNTIVEIEDDDEIIEERDFFSGLNQTEDWMDEEKERVIKCENCGATTVLDVKVTASRCAFCDSPHICEVKEENERSSIRPESLIPFKIHKDKAKSLFKDWIKGKFFAPKAVKEEYILDKIQGVYIPHWTFDSQTYSRYSASIGEHYYVTVDDKRVRKTRWHRESGHHEMFFNDELVNASKNVDQNMIEALEPFHFNELVPFKHEYLSGFMAEKYGIDLEGGWQHAKNDMEREIESTIRSHLHGDEIRNFSCSTNFQDVTYKHILLPIWVASYTFNNKVYNFLVNGQTGEVQGKTPIDKLKVAIVTILGAGLATGAYFMLDAM